jgi:hypothetical protein
VTINFGFIKNSLLKSLHSSASVQVAQQAVIRINSSRNDRRLDDVALQICMPLLQMYSELLQTFMPALQSLSGAGQVN